MSTAGPITILPLSGMGEISPGSNLAQLLSDALNALSPQSGDILVVTQKIVSKAEGRFVSLGSMVPDDEALKLSEVTGKDPRLIALALAQSTGVVRAAPGVLITRHRLGMVMANAGIDASNIGPGDEDRVLLLPDAPDCSAQALRAAMFVRFGVEIAVVISDSFGRPWRHGVTNVAIGAAGLPALIDERGKLDRDGRPLRMTQIAVGDLLACASALAMGEGAESVPAVLIRGYRTTAAPRPAADLIRPVGEDLFR